MYLRPCKDDGLADGDVVPLVPGEHGMESTGLKKNTHICIHVTMELFNISNQPSVRFTNLFYLDEQESEGGESDDPVCTTSPDGD